MEERTAWLGVTDRHDRHHELLRRETEACEAKWHGAACCPSRLSAQPRLLLSSSGRGKRDAPVTNSLGDSVIREKDVERKDVGGCGMSGLLRGTHFILIIMRCCKAFSLQKGRSLVLIFKTQISHLVIV